MSTHFTTIVPINYDIAKKEDLIIKVIEWLKKDNIIKPQPSYCALGDELAYAPGTNHKKIIDDEYYHEFTSLKSNGLEIVKERQVFTAMAFGLDEVNCPVCQTNLIEEDWSEAIQQWHDDSNQGDLTCTNCNTTSRIINFEFVPTWVFGELGFTFWNWPIMKKSFFIEFEKEIGAQCKIVEGKL